MGKKKSGSTSEAAKVSRDWSASAMSNRDITKLRALGFISASEEDIRLPSRVTPNSILHLSIFITVCEAFLGIDPQGSLEEDLHVKRHNDKEWPPSSVALALSGEVDYFDYPMKESVQGLRNKWFYLRDPIVPGRRSNLPPFDDVLVAHKKKSWRNALSPKRGRQPTDCLSRLSS
ncbi:hypothetical protein QYE76_057445 [Lolium multiflorum]|uniref:Transposase (putative) gypsy type domain-containing protein n=1 Tax=Lolium multiflorum TaxID=4521 RepID=A0AAD8T3I0_LOLMU|nr:hypothetical protein QYE76_057445 [Lolium multiflorum]